MSSTQLVRVNEDGEVIPYTPEGYLASLNVTTQQQLAAAYDAACLSLLGENDVQVDGGRSFKKKSAWRKLARHFGISTAVVGVQQQYLGETFVATVTVKASGPWGQSSDAVGACATDEATGRRTITIADAIATAETRATNRAVSNLIAMGEVTAEEITGKDTPQGKAPVKAAPTGDIPACPTCNGKMWDNRVGKKNPKAPDFKCKDKACDGVVWPPKDTAANTAFAKGFEPVDEDGFPL